MAQGVNKVILIGNVGNDPEVRSTQNGNSVASFRMATGKRWTDKQTGEVKEKVEWHNIVIWNENLVKVVKDYVRKGSKLYIEGELQTRKWQARDDSDRWTTEVVLQGFGSTLNLLDSKKRDDEDENGATEPQEPREGGGKSSGTKAKAKSKPASGGSYSAGMDLDDEIPFMYEWR